MSYKLLNANGEVRAVSADEKAALVSVDASDPVAAFDQLSSMSDNDDVAFVELPSSADGRAFSVVGQITAQTNESKSTTNPIWIGGDLLPDQVTLAFQCGAAAVLIDDSSWNARGEDDWMAALKPPVGIGYRSTVWSGVQDISAMRT